MMIPPLYFHSICWISACSSSIRRLCLLWTTKQHQILKSGWSKKRETSALPGITNFTLQECLGSVDHHAHQSWTCLAYIKHVAYCPVSYADFSELKMSNKNVWRKYPLWGNPFHWERTHTHTKLKYSCTDPTLLYMIRFNTNTYYNSQF